jgi:hypothetical protein
VPEVADLLRNEYQVWNALNLDGGGSTTMAMQDPADNLRNDDGYGGGPRRQRAHGHRDLHRTPRQGAALSQEPSGRSVGDCADDEAGARETLIEWVLHDPGRAVGR